MLYLLGIHIIILIVSHILGYFFYRYLLRISLPSSVYLVVTGLIVAALFGQLVSLFHSTRFENSIPLFILLFLWGISNKNYTKIIASNILKAVHLPPFLIVTAVSLYLLFLLLSAGPTLMDDSESYHIQMVKWIQEYGTVPGLANLHSRYGFHSSWFNTAALFSPHGNKNYFTALNSFTGSLFTLQVLWFSYKNFISNKLTLAFSSTVLILFILVFWPFLRANMQNLNYDYIFSICTVVILLATIEKKESTLLPVLFLWPVFLITVRVLYFPALIMTFYAIYHLVKQRKTHQLFVLAVTAIVLVFPFLIRNIILSGYPLYPSTIGKFLNFDWDVPHKQIDSLLTYIKYYNRTNTRYLTISETQKTPFPFWVGNWARYLFYYDKILLSLSIPGIILAAARIRKNQFTTFQKLFSGFLIIQTIVWFTVAPDPRFIYGIFFSWLFLSAFFFAELFHNKFHFFFKVLTKVSFVFIISFSLFMTIQKVLQEKIYRNYLSPSELPKPEVTKFKIDSITFSIPHKFGNNWNSRCYALPVPCVYDSLSGVKLRGKDISDGFYINEIKDRHVP